MRSFSARSNFASRIPSSRKITASSRPPSSKASLFQRALEFRKSNTVEPQDYGEFKTVVEQGFALSHWCGSADCEAKIKEETKATMRCIPLEQAGGTGKCIYCGQAASEQAIFAKAY